jgi:hypothetical protein
MTTVSKRDGRHEEFIPEKIATSATKAGAPPEIGREIAERIGRSAGASIGTAEIRELVPDDLERTNTRWRENWEVYDRAVKRRGSRPTVRAAPIR